ncbi:hypothetical protein GCM10009827_049230 [Dactylosporangium maewongense]|uniref:Polysaccharide biosynthesis protein n=1 Tax=Dactylosporangium maewongense TaxID=634393 RepID=A0ABP4LND5_9ACTN
MTLLAPEAEPRTTAPGGGMMLALFAGRGAFRATSQLAPLVLAVPWGAARFADYAGAVGVSAWTVFVASSGEKAALKLVPRTRRLGGYIARVVLRVAAVPVTVAAVAFAAAFLSGRDQLRVVAAALLWSAALGLLQLAVGLHRVRGHPRTDAVTFAAMTGALLTLSAVTFHFAWPPLWQLTMLAAAALTASAVLLWRLPSGWSVAGRGARGVGTSVRRRRVAWLVLRTCVLLGLPELIASLSLAVCYLILRIAGHGTESGPFYVAVTASGFCSAALTYLLRLRQPVTSLRLRGPAGRAGRAKARRILRFAVLLCLPGVPLVAFLAPGTLLLTLLTCLETPLFALVAYAGYLVENTDGRSPRLTAAAAAVGLVVVTVSAAVLVPHAASSGAMAALLLSAGASALSLDAGLSGRWRRTVPHGGS